MDVLHWMKYGHPDLFITTTTNPSWPEIKDIVFSYASKIQQKIVATIKLKVSSRHIHRDHINTEETILILPL